MSRDIEVTVTPQGDQFEVYARMQGPRKEHTVVITENNQACTKWADVENLLDLIDDEMKRVLRRENAEV